MAALQGSPCSPARFTQARLLDLHPDRGRRRGTPSYKRLRGGLASTGPPLGVVLGAWVARTQRQFPDAAMRPRPAREQGNAFAAGATRQRSIVQRSPGRCTDGAGSGWPLRCRRLHPRRRPSRVRPSNPAGLSRSSRVAQSFWCGSSSGSGAQGRRRSLGAFHRPKARRAMDTARSCSRLDPRSPREGLGQVLRKCAAGVSARCAAAAGAVGTFLGGTFSCPEKFPRRSC